MSACAVCHNFQIWFLLQQIQIVWQINVSSKTAGVFAGFIMNSLLPNSDLN